MDKLNKTDYNGFEINDTVFYMNNEAYIESLFSTNGQKYAVISLTIDYSEDTSNTSDSEVFITVNLRNLTKTQLTPDTACVEANKIIQNARQLAHTETVKAMQEAKDKLYAVKSETQTLESDLRAKIKKFEGLEQYFKFLNDEYKYLLIISVSTNPQEMIHVNTKEKLSTRLLYSIEELKTHKQNGEFLNLQFTDTNVAIKDGNSFPRRYITMSLKNSYTSTVSEVKGFETIEEAMVEFNKMISNSNYTFTNAVINTDALFNTTRHPRIEQFVKQKENAEKIQLEKELSEINNKKLKLEQKLQTVK